MRKCLAIAAIFVASFTIAGDFVYGPNLYELDLAASQKQYQMTAADHRWADSLLRNLHQNGHVTYLTRTDLPVWRDGQRVDGVVYRPLGEFSGWYTSPMETSSSTLRVSGLSAQAAEVFSMHAPKSRNFIVALYFRTPCVPLRRHGDIQLGKIWYYADKSFDRLSLDQ